MLTINNNYLIDNSMLLIMYSIIQIFIVKNLSFVIGINWNQLYLS